MINRIEILAFKRFIRLVLECGRLTVLTGANGAGKSSVIHALLLLRKAARSEATAIELNDSYGLQLGCGIDVLNAGAIDNTIEISVHEEQPYIWRLLASENEFDLTLDKITFPDQYDGLLRVNDSRFTYLCAERFGPRDTLAASPASPENLNIGVHGEYAAQVLALYSSQKVHDYLILSPSSSTAALLQQQAEAWLSEIVRPLQIDADWIPGSLSTKLRFKSPNTAAIWTRPTNMGFGVSYALPIIIAGLRAQSEDILIIENPEAHLHPAGQSKIGDFLARVASTGCQVFIETHSDHVINGIRRSVASGAARLGGDEVSINFFTDDATAAQITIGQAGQLSSWPKGFFDQGQVDLSQLARIQRVKK